MKTIIYSMDERTGTIKEKAIYCLPALKAMICYIEQNINMNTHTWLYPENIKGIRKSEKREGTYYYDDIKHNAIIQAYEQ